MPLKALSAALARAARDPRAWDRPPTAGITGLRAWFARSPRRFALVGGAGGPAMIGVGISVAVTGRHT